MVTVFFAVYMLASVVQSGAMWHGKFVFATLNQNDKAASVVLSNGNLTASMPTNNDLGMVRSTRAITSSKAYFEGTFVAGNPASGFSELGIGFVNASAFLSQPPYVQGVGVGTQPNIFVASNAAGLYTNVDAVIGDVWCVAIDATAKLFWIRKNGDNWNNSGAADPATGAGGVDISVLTFPLFAGIFVENDVSTPATITVNFGASAYAFTPPAGFGNL